MKAKNKTRLTFGVIVDWIVGWGDVNYYQNNIVARLGGDEFTILVADALPRDEKQIIKRLYQLFDRYNQKNIKSYYLSISIGSTYFDPGSSLSFDELLVQADKSLYNEKQRKKT